MIVLIDNYDSFTFNLVHYLGELGRGGRRASQRQDRASTTCWPAKPDAIVLSPGPCTPNEAGICLDLIAQAAPSIPILGVCLGHQAIGQAFGGKVVRAPAPVHGKLSRGPPPGPGRVPRHQRAVQGDALPFAGGRARHAARRTLTVTAETDDGLVMGLAHKHAAGARRAVPSRKHRLRARPSDPEEFPRTAPRNAATRADARPPLRGRVSDDFKGLIAKVAAGAALTREEAARAFDRMMSGEATPSQMGGLLMALRVRGETVDEITGAVSTMRAKMLKVAAPPDAIDVVGTGGDASGSYNISTCAAFIVAGAGVPVAKHGNRALSSQSGAADVLGALGVKIELRPDEITRCIYEAGIGFMFAPAHHPATKNVAPTRVELGTRTIFNLLGPLSNPASVKRQMIGVFSRQWIEPMAQVSKNLGSECVWVAHGSDGLDEITTSGPTHVAALENGTVRTFEINPEDIGIAARQAGGAARRRRRGQCDGAAWPCSRATRARTATSRCSMPRRRWWSPAAPRI